MVARSWAERVMEKVYQREGYDVISVGAPDFILLRGNSIEFVEIKTGNDRPSDAQKRAIALLKKHGFTARSELIEHRKNSDRPGYHKIRAYREGVGNNRTFHMISETLQRLIGKKGRVSL